MNYWNGTKVPSLEAQVLYRRALEMAGQGRYEAALNDLQKVVLIAPRFTKALMEMGNCLNALGRYPEALAAYTQVLEIDPLVEGASVRRDMISKKIGNSPPERKYFTGKTHPVQKRGGGDHDRSGIGDYPLLPGIQRKETITSPLQAVYRPEFHYHVKTYGNPAF